MESPSAIGFLYLEIPCPVFPSNLDNVSCVGSAPARSFIAKGVGMKSHEQLRVGNTIVRCLDTGRFVFRDASDPAQIQTIEEAHIPEIIEFLYEWSPSAMKRLRIEV